MRRPLPPARPGHVSDHISCDEFVQYMGGELALGQPTPAGSADRAVRVLSSSNRGTHLGAGVGCYSVEICPMLSGPGQSNDRIVGTEPAGATVACPTRDCMCTASRPASNRGVAPAYGRCAVRGRPIASSDARSR